MNIVVSVFSMFFSYSDGWVCWLLKSGNSAGSIHQSVLCSRLALTGQAAVLVCWVKKPKLKNKCKNIYFLLVILILCKKEVLEPTWNSQEIFENSR